MVFLFGIIDVSGGGQQLTPVLEALDGHSKHGYDFAGVGAIQIDGSLFLRRARTVADLSAPQSGVKVGVGHLRWATHGPVSMPNSHPILSSRKSVLVVHNGVVENHSILRKQLVNKGVSFSTDTDTEVLANLVEDIMMRDGGGSFEDAVRSAMRAVRGTCGAVFMCTQYPDTLVAVNIMSTVLVGTFADGTVVVTSDTEALTAHMGSFVALKTGEYAVLTGHRHGGVETIADGKPELEAHTSKAPPTDDLHGHMRLRKLHDGRDVEQCVEELIAAVEAEELSKGQYSSFVLKDIMQQPEGIRGTMRGRVVVRQSDKGKTVQVKLGGMEHVLQGKRVVEHMSDASRLILIGCGSSYHAGLLGKQIIEDITRIPVHVELGGEFYRRPVLLDRDSQGRMPVVVLLSQSGETTDMLSCLRVAQSAGAVTFGICNAVNSAMARQTDAGVFLHCGREGGIAATRTFTSTVVVTMLIALVIRQHRGTLGTDPNLVKLVESLVDLPDTMSDTLARCESAVQAAGLRYRYARNFLSLGRGLNFPVALEAAAKLVELACIHCEGYPAAEMKHGPIALIDNFMPVLVVAPKDQTYEKVVSNIQEVQARQGSVICITDQENHNLDSICDCVITIPHKDPTLFPLHAILVVQMFAHNVATGRGLHVDSPRHLTKTVV